jgi:hypothetical protein
MRFVLSFLWALWSSGKVEPYNYIASKSAVSSVSIISRIELPIAIILILSANNKIETGIFSSI